MSQPARDELEKAHDTPAGFDSAPPVGPDTEQVESVAAWLRWHAVELAGVGVPLALTLLVSMWFVVLVVPAAVLWGVHETRHTREREQLRAVEREALTSADTTTGEETTQ